MGRSKHIPLPLKGKIGDIVFYTLNGQTYARKAPFRKSTAVPKACQSAVNMFTQASVTYRFLPEKLLGVWKIAARGMAASGRNFFIKMNFHAFPAEGKEPYYELLKFSSGSLPLPLQLQTTDDDSGEFCRLQWDTSTFLPYTSPEDKLWVVELHTDNPLVICMVDDAYALRSDGFCVFPLRYELGKETHLYCFFSSPDNSNFSDCKYFCINKQPLRE